MSSIDHKQHLEDHLKCDENYSFLEKTSSPLKVSIKYADSPDNKKDRFILVKPIFLCLAISFGGFIFGWDIGTIGGISNMKSFQNNFGTLHDPITNERYLPDILIGLIISIFNIGCAIGGLTLAKLGDFKGRKFGIYLTLFVYCTGLIIQLTKDQKWYQFLIGRIFTGLAVGSTAVLVPMFISESAPLRIRGAMVVFYQLMVTLGILIGNVINYACKRMTDEATNNISWQFPIFLGFVWTLVIIVGLMFTPESAQYLIIKKNAIDDAKRSFSKMNGVSETDKATIEYVEETIKRQVLTGKQENRQGLFEFITGKPQYGIRLLTGILVMSFQQLSGVNYFFYYGTTIFKSVNMDPYITSIILSSVNFMATFGGIYMVESLGRKASLLLGSIGMFFCMLIYTSVGGFALGSSASGFVMIAATCVYIVFFATTLGPVTFVIVSELFPMRTKATSMAICSSFNWMFNFLISFLTPVITSRIGFLYGYIFAACLLLSATFVWFMVPETAKKTEADIDNYYMKTKGDLHTK